MEKTISQIKSFYRNDRIAHSYIDERFSKPLGKIQHKIQVAIINNTIDKFNAQSILEVACGPARLTTEIRARKLGIAIDSSLHMLRIAKSRINRDANWLFIQTDAFNPGIRQRFQLIYSLRFIRHFEFRERIKIYRVISSLLRSGGIFIFDAVHFGKNCVVRKLENKNQKEIYDKIYDAPKEIINELKSAGFEVLDLKATVNHFYLQAIISRLSSLINFQKFGSKIIYKLEKVPFCRPLEWIVICKKISI